MQDNLATLRRRGVHVVEPESGRLAGGDVGAGPPGRPERHRRRGRARPRPGATSPGVRVLVTAGGTREPIDPVRVIANRSSGKQGYAIAAEAAAAGRRGHARHHRRPARRRRASRSCAVETAAEMAGRRATARADGRRGRHGRRGRRLPARRQPPTGKIKKDDGRARDRARADPRHPRRPRRGASAPARCSSASPPRPTTCVANAAGKLRAQAPRPHRANDVSAPGVGFEHDTNAVDHRRRRRRRCRMSHWPTSGPSPAPSSTPSSTPARRRPSADPDDTTQEHT